MVIVFARSTSLMTLIRRGVDEIELNLPPLRVAHVLGRNVANRCYPVMLRIDNSPDFISLTLAEWADIHAVKLELIQSGKPTQNAFIQRFNRAYRTEILNFICSEC
ncbi:TPA: transposase [Escherichia coli]|nr:transposase family protein [Escherichia coli]EMF1780207.1 transposase [Escherichia coli]MBS9183602.1 integrase core domain-containing protein [Escherichia coli]MRE43277.1 transposase [Escherichia coli]MRF14128.1 transposase [Escherichia coli]